jgi:hypothetical protein
VVVGLAMLAVSCANGGSAGTRPSDDVDASTGAGGDPNTIHTMAPDDASTPVGDGNVTIVSTLPPPWQYFENGTEHAFKDPMLAAGVKDQFTGAPMAGAALVYPLGNSLHPNNLGLITLQWTKASAQDQVWRIDIAGGTDTFHFFVPCPRLQCTYAMPESEWLDLGKRFAGQDVTVTLNGTNGKGGAVETSMPSKQSFSPEPVVGALYYWAASTRSIKRAQFGSKRAVPFISPQSTTSEYYCVACHSVSRNGKTIAFAVSEQDGQDTAAIQTAPTQDPTKPYVKPQLVPLSQTIFAGIAVAKDVPKAPLDHYGNSVALSPDGSVAAINGLAPAADGRPLHLELRNTQTGAQIQRYTTGDQVFGGDSSSIAIMPEWSPDGKELAAAMSSSYDCTWPWITCDGSIVVFPYANNALSKPRTLVNHANGYFHFYPTWSPDGKYIAFVSSPDSKSSYQNAQGVIRMVPSTGGPYDCPGPSCYELTNGTQYTLAQAMTMGKHSTWPKFTPFAQGPNKSVMFISFTTAIDYGILALNKNQLWMFAVDTSKLGSGDPSYAPIWLPYQDINDSSYEPYWTETLPCTKDPAGGCNGCVDGEVCLVDGENNCKCSTESNIK